MSIIAVWTRTVDPICEPVTLTEAKKHCNIDIDDDNEYIDSLIVAATEFIEHRTGRQIVKAAFEQRQDVFPSECDDWAFRLRVAPVLSVESITYLDLDGEEQTFDPDWYVVDSNSTPGRITLAPYCYWPYPGLYPNAVKVTYSAGFVDSEDPDTLRKSVPRRLKLAILWLVAHWYRNREAVSQVNQIQVPFGVDSIIRHFKVIT